MASTSAHEIVILGVNYAGLNLTHQLLRQTIPALARANPSLSYHITLVSPNTHFYFKPGAPRALINPTSLPAEKIFRSLAEAFQQYGENTTSIQGKAVALGPDARTVTVYAVNGQSEELKYDSLFICTGTTSASPLWTLHDDHQVTAEALDEMHAQLPEAKSVLISGAGPAGVETAGEIAHAYPNAKVTLVAGNDVLSGLKPAVGTKAKKLLADAKVEVLTKLRVEESTPSGSETRVHLSDGSSRIVDVFVDSRGAQKVNSEFLPKSWLDESGRVNTRDAYFRVKGDGESDVSNVYVLGDIVAGSKNTAIELDAHVVTVSSSFAVDVASAFGREAKPSGGGFLSFIPGRGPNPIAQKEFKPFKDTILVPIGPNGGVGLIMGFQPPSLMVKKAKSEKFLIDLVEPMITGIKYGKA